MLLAVLAMAVYAGIMLHGPQGIPALRGKWREIRELQQGNAELEARVGQLRDRVDDLEHNRTEQQLEIRKHLKMLQKGETLVVLGDQPAQVIVAPAPSPTPTPAAAATPPPSPTPRRAKPSPKPAAGAGQDAEPPDLPAAVVPAPPSLAEPPPPEAPPPAQ